eukprot:NODE_5121_length_696_cov_13.068541_g4958_i0.p2 GENE.NODE_5121_length_696_cov_13.068541_g4958_i0~~NODE_5121_length_696_cov_13.068541_g4958_i0.p2  ORF type:complete len:195 (-),score=49.14 NODE_5121_length_696_cov_13.068541_g4958_i0:31-615(-)
MIYGPRKPVKRKPRNTKHKQRNKYLVTPVDDSYAVEVTVQFAPMPMPPLCFMVDYACTANTIIATALRKHAESLEFVGYDAGELHMDPSKYLLQFNAPGTSSDASAIHLLLLKGPSLKRIDEMQAEQRRLKQEAIELKHQRNTWLARTQCTINDDIRISGWLAQKQEEQKMTRANCRLADALEHSRQTERTEVD